MKILVSGGAGYIGSHTVLQLVAADRLDDLVPAHADQPVQPPHRLDHVEGAQGAVPGQRVLVVRVDEGAVDVQAGDRGFSHAR